MRLTYWKSECLTDSDCYSIRTRTKKECVSLISQAPWHSWGHPVKVSLEYSSGFELLESLLGEDRGHDLILSGEGSP